MTTSTTNNEDGNEMQDFKFKTGRNYGKDQEIEVTDIVSDFDDFGLLNFSAKFNDDSRCISGRIDCIAFGSSKKDICNAVMEEYDNGRYL